MRDTVMDLVILPLPILWLLILGLLLWRWRRLSAALVIGATLLFALFAMPAVGRLLQAPLVAGAEPYDAAVATQPLAVVVPTAGSFADPDGGWWPTEGAIRRGVVGRRLMQQLDLPLVISGGVLKAGQPPEAETLAAALGLTGGALRLETTARNSAENAAAVAALLDAAPGDAVLLVTSPLHLARMSAALRHHGLTVYAESLEAVRPPLGPADFLPSDRGLKMSRGALYEYFGIAWYLLTGRIDPADLAG